MKNNFYFLIYRSTTEDISVNTLIKYETIWLTQKTMGKLFGCSINDMSRHLKNILNEGELHKNSTTEEISVFSQESNRQIKLTQKFYNIDAIISVNDRVNSAKATKFIIWATPILKEYKIKGLIVDDESLKQGKTLFVKDYFSDLLETVRSIRASEKKIWEQIKDVFAEYSMDYDGKSKVTQNFYATYQNKFHYAITGKTAAEIIYTSADRNSKNMGLKTWENAPYGEIQKKDVTIAKNYLSEEEIKKLEKAVSEYFNYVEDLIEKENTFIMAEFANSIDEFLDFSKYGILEGKGKISKKQADKKATLEYNEFKKKLKKKTS